MPIWLAPLDQVDGLILPAWVGSGLNGWLGDWVDWETWRLGRRGGPLGLKRSDAGWARHSVVGWSLTS
jgi:hypothetical protein